MTQTTSGPWIAEPGVRGKIAIISRSDKLNGLPYRVAVVDDWKHGPADAQLIAAAPAMLAALKAFAVKWEQVLPAIKNAFVLQHVHGMDYNGPTLADEINQMAAALAAAEAPYVQQIKTNVSAE